MKGAIRAGAFRLFISLAMVVGLTLATSAQSIPSRSLQGFNVPDPHLRSETKAVRLSSVIPAPEAAPNRGSQPRVSDLTASRLSTTGLAAESSWEELQIQRLWVAQYRNREIRDAQSPIIRYLSTTFDPVPVRMRKATLSSSIWTAIKRRNPLSLLNPIFLNLSW